MVDTYREDTDTPAPFLIKGLIIVHLTFGCLSGFFNSPLGSKLSISFQSIFALSLKSLLKGFIWQPLTFIFVPEMTGPLNFYLLFSLCFDGYLLWLLGRKVVRDVGNREFLKLFFIPPAIAALFSSFLLFKTSYAAPIHGLSFGIIPLTMAYFFLHPKAQFSFFSPHPVRLRWVGLALIILYLLQDCADLRFSCLLGHLFTLIISHIYMLVVLKKKSPFSFSHKLDQWALSLFKSSQDSKVIELYSYSAHDKNIRKTFRKIKYRKALNNLDRLRLWLFERNRRS